MVCQQACGIESGVDDRGVAGAPAQMAAQEIAYLCFGGTRPLTKIMIERHHNPRGAEAALQRGMAFESPLKNAEPIGSGRQTFHRADVAAVDLHRKRKAGTSN